MSETWNPMSTAPWDRAVRVKLSPTKLRPNGFTCWGIRNEANPMWALGPEPGGEMRIGSDLDNMHLVGWRPLTDVQIDAYPGRPA